MTKTKKTISTKIGTIKIMACICGHSREEHIPECCECPCIAYEEDCETDLMRIFERMVIEKRAKKAVKDILNKARYKFKLIRKLS